MALTIPPKPAAFTPEGAPLGVEIKYLSFWRERALIKPRSQFAHTNGASVESTIEAQVRYSEASPNNNTAPHYLIDRTGRARKTLPTNRRGIANATVTPATNDGKTWPTLTAAQRASITQHGQIRDWSLAYETTDLGWPTPGGKAGYSEAQGGTLAVIMAYESIVHDMPLDIISDWWGAGAASHTDPFEFPYTTIHRGKTCPGDQKKQDLRNWVLPHARAVRAAWLAPPVPVTPVPGGLMSTVCVRKPGEQHLYLTDWSGAPPVYIRWPGHEWHLVAALWALEDQGVRFASAPGKPGEQGRKVPVPFELVHGQLATFDMMLAGHPTTDPPPA